MREFKFVVYETLVGNVVSLWPFDDDFRRDIPAEAIVGQLIAPVPRESQIPPEAFAANTVFKDFLHTFIAANAPIDPGLQATLPHQPDGFVYIIDQRTETPGGDVPGEDIIGRFEVKGGQLKPDSYERNPHHRLLSDRGFFRLGALLEERLIAEIERLHRA